MALYDYQGNIIATGGSGSPIDGKRIALIGDSNTQYNAAKFKAYMEETYGCTFTPLGTAGATWENGEGVTHTDSAVGRVDTIIANADSSNLITDYDCIVIMMGTNCTNVGTLEDTSADVSTMCGAVRYCMEKLCYYGRKIPIGVILPFHRYDETSTELPERFQFIEKIAKEFSVPVLNLYSEGRVIPDTLTPDAEHNYYLGDSVHLGDNGVIQVNRIMGKWIAYVL